MTRFPRFCALIALLLLLSAGLLSPAQAQTMNGQHLKRTLPPDTTITATDRVTVKGEEVPYEVTTGTQPV